MGLEEDKKSKSYCYSDDSFFLVYSGHMVWLRVLSVYGLVREKLGLYNNPDSYIEFLIETFTGLDVSRIFVDIFALIMLVAALLMSIITNVMDWRKKKRVKS